MYEREITGRRKTTLLFRYAKSGISPAPKAYVSTGRRTRRVAMINMVVVSLHIVED